jgi:hypothetical protein
MATESKDLVPVEAGRTPDLYERKYMPGEGTVLYRDKRRAPWQLQALFATSGLGALIATIASGQLWALPIVLPPLLLIWLLFAVLRVTVSEGHVNVQYGLMGPKIPIGAIESAEAITYDWKTYGGWGIRYAGKREWMYNMPGDGGRAVRIVWHDARGRRVTAIGSRQANDLAASIHHAQKALPAGARQSALPAGKPDAGR